MRTEEVEWQETAEEGNVFRLGDEMVRWEEEVEEVFNL